MFLTLVISLLTSSTFACFGPKLFVGTEPGLAGEMRYHLVALYLHEKTGIDSVHVVYEPGQNALQAISAQKIDLGFSTADESDIPVLLKLTDGQVLYSGKRPLEDLQFSTAPRALQKLQQRLNNASLQSVEEQIAAGELPAAAIRNFMLEAGWI